MQFTFDAHLEHQIHAVESVVNLLEGQPRIEAETTFSLSAGFAAVPNRLDLDDDALLKNLNAVQTANGIAPDAALMYIDETIDALEGMVPVRFPNFSVEMETGTGKTYVYLRTAMELFRRYGLRKFIVVVPSVAIREGVLKTLQVTERHFREQYDNVPCRYSVYDSANLTHIRHFAQSDSLEIMVMTIDSFNKSSNIIRQSIDRLQGETPIHLVQATRPILILDEPQNMESELRVKALSALNPLLALRYSATHRNPYNVVYRLTPFEAYRQGLVKRIEVASMVEEGGANRVFMRVDAIRTDKRTITAHIALHKLMKNGIIKEQVVTVKPGDSLEEKAARPEYAGFEVDEINPGGKFVRFANDAELKVGESQGVDKEAIFEAQIRFTIKEHFRKQARLKRAGIKVLSLFFIDRVDNYRPSDGVIRRLFVNIFNEEKAHFPEYESTDANQVQAAYFAQKRHRSGDSEWLDTVSGKSKEDEAAYDLIMKDKERLLSFDEPAAFIFSHSALREGWDNPNVFQICTLNQTASEMKKRQEVGRGLRLAVDQSGSRITDEAVNLLTVIANESYERYVQRLQSEIEEEYGRAGLPPKPADARQRRTVALRKEFILRPEFKELWNKIKHKTRYAVKVDTEKLLGEVKRELDGMEIRPPRITATKVQLQVGEDDAFLASLAGEPRAQAYSSEHAPLPNLIEIMAHMIGHFSPPIRLTRNTLLDVYKRSNNKEAALKNPQEFAVQAARIIREKLADQLVQGIQYEKINEWYEMSQLDVPIDSWSEYLVPADHSIYDQVICESEPEREFVRYLESRQDVRLYVKLPSWFTVKTPVGNYNPDWAIVVEDRDVHGDTTGKPLLYLVRETKGTDWKTNARREERYKVECGERHFEGALGVNFEVWTGPTDQLL